LGAGVRIFKTKWFVRYARHERLSDYAILEGILQEAT
jgi:hypothetical protein